jgi:glycogen debranching enzyme
VKVNDRSDESIKQAREWLAPLIEMMNSRGCIGQIAEIFEATEPYRPVGCPTQAWSVAEALRLAVMLLL